MKSTIIYTLFFLSIGTLTAQIKDSIPSQTKEKQENVITGTVTDEEGLPLIGVTIINARLQEGAVTNFDGEYSIPGALGDILSFSYIGYAAIQVEVVSYEFQDIRLEFQDDLLEEVVVMAKIESLQEKYRTIPCADNAVRLIGVDQYDSRFERYELDSLVKWQHSIIKKSNSVAVIIEKERLYAISDQEYQLDANNTLGEVYNLCYDQAFINQPVVGSGTGFIVGENTMTTARHVFERPIEDYVIVFGYEMVDKNQKVNSKIVASNIFYPKSIVQEFEELDVISFKVDRDFDRPILEWETSRDLDQESEIYMIGYPSGIPQKIALNAGVVDNSNFQYFLTSLDSFQGNSGSPVFNFCTNKLIGVLVSGELDYEYNGDCYETTLCKYPYCKGEKVVRIEEILIEK